MGTAETTAFDFFKDLPQKDDGLSAEILQELKEYKEAFVEHDGLIPSAAAPELLGISKGRVWQLKKEYSWVVYEFFGKQFYSRRQLEDFSKLDRSGIGRPKKGKPSLKKIVKALAKDAVSD